MTEQLKVVVAVVAVELTGRKRGDEVVRKNPSEAS
jgi:hypothetical protein